MRILVLFILSTLFSLKLVGQFTTLNDPVLFQTTNQGMFGPNSTFNLNYELELFRFNWNQNLGTQSNIDTTLFGKYGYDIDGGTSGFVAAKLYSRDWNTGSIDVNYPINVKIDYPTPNTIDRGETIKIKTSYTVDPSAKLKTTFPQVGRVGLELDYQMRFFLTPTLCFIGCATVFDFDKTIKGPFTIFEVSANSIKYPCVSGGTNGICTSNLLPYTFNTSYMSGSFDLPDVKTTSTIGADQCLYANGEDEYITLTLNIFELLSTIPIPQTKAVLDALSGGGCYNSAGGSLKACINYTLLKAYFITQVYNKQEFSFCPDIYTTFKFPIPVQYTVTDPNAGNSTVEGPLQSDEIRIKLGNDVNVKYPCNYDYLDVTTSHELENEINNKTYDDIRFSVNLQALFYEIKIDAFGLGQNEDDATGEFNGFNFSGGPLWEDTYPVGSLEGFTWFEDSWELPGFTGVPGLPFKLSARPYFATTTSGSDISCFGAKNGSLSVAVTNGVSPFKYEWSDGTTTNSSSRNATNSNLKAGNQFVVIKDANNCMSYATYTVEGPKDPVQISSYTVEPVSCNGAKDGEISVSVFGGTGGYTYNWSTASGSSSVMNASAGNEVLTVTDSKGCSVTKTIPVPTPDPLTAQFNITPVTCFGGDNGIAEIIPAGGTPPYSYIWSNGGTNKISNNWQAGSHTVTLSDGNGCSEVISFTMPQPSQPITITNTTTNISCFGLNDGSVSVSVTGGVTPYTYQWSDSNFNQHLSVTNTASNLYPSRWNLSITDAKGCIEFASFEVTEPKPLQAFDSITNVSCHGGSDGVIDLQTFGGTQPYRFAWSNGAAGEDNRNITAGNYTVVITDFNGCTLTKSYTITQPLAPLTIEPYQLNVRCKDFKDGLAATTVIGGTKAYSYAWNTGDTTTYIDSLLPGNYYVTVTDKNGCSASQSYTITSPDSLLISSIMDSVRCHSFSDGRVTANITGGTLPYDVSFGDSNYSKYNTNQAIVFDSLIAAQYYITVKDANNCVYTHAVEVLEPDTLLWEIDSTDALCYGSSTGKADLTVTGGIKPYSYVWSDSVTTSEDLINAPAGYYTVQITDYNNCIIDGYVTILQPDSIQITDSAYSTTCLENNDGKIEIEVIGGIVPYTYLWSNGEISQNIYNLSNGTYMVTVTDANNCSEILYATVDKSLADCIDPPNAFTPDGDGYNDTWLIDNINNYEGATVTIFNKWGKILYESKGQYTPWDGKVNGKILPSATYYYYIDLNRDGRIYRGPLTIVKQN